MILVTVPLMIQAQFKQDVPSIPGLTNNYSSGASSIFGIDLSRVNFYHSFSMEVSSIGGEAVPMGLLKTSFVYAINPQVNVRGFVGLINSPFSSMTPMDDQYSFANGLNKDNILYGGEITYHPKENVFFQIGINKLPSNSFNPYYSHNPYRPLGY